MNNLPEGGLLLFVSQVTSVTARTNIFQVSIFSGLIRYTNPHELKLDSKVDS